ncbi:hypothetical protein C8Q77DRAFT_667184 [Trametes polyzona]|nr:hypothetical protein C8Q77DRAFT_667184 [Trametes polyzona]
MPYLVAMGLSKALLAVLHPVAVIAPGGVSMSGLDEVLQNRAASGCVPFHLNVPSYSWRARPPLHVGNPSVWNPAGRLCHCGRTPRAFWAGPTVRSCNNDWFRSVHATTDQGQLRPIFSRKAYKRRRPHGEHHAHTSASTSVSGRPSAHRLMIGLGAACARPANGALCSSRHGCHPHARTFIRNTTPRLPAGRAREA